MPPIAPILIVLAAGVALAVQAPTNAALARHAGSLTLASLTSFLIGTAALVLVWAVVDRTPVRALGGAPGWSWVGGLYGAGFVAAMAFAAPRLGLATTLTLAIASQLAAALALDHAGLLGLKPDPITATKLAGAALVLAGVFLVRR